MFWSGIALVAVGIWGLGFMGRGRTDKLIAKHYKK